MNFKQKFVGDRAFYGRVLTITVPIFVQNLFTNFVNFLDNIMVGQLGTESMSGVAIANQLIFVFNLAIFGALSGIGIFTAQFFGSGDEDGVRYTMRAKLYIVLIILVLFITASLWKGRELISLFLQAGDSADRVALTLSEGLRYLEIMLIGLVPQGIKEAYASTLRESGQTMVPMKAGVIAVICNLIGNYILIFGKFGAPAMGVAGAAVSTVISRFVELMVVVPAVHRSRDVNHYAVGLFRSPYVPGKLIRQMIRRGSPLMVNEFLWSVGMTALTQCYSMRGLTAVAAYNICGTISNMFSQAYFSFGSAIAIMVGQLLGAGKTKEAQDTDTKLIAFALLVSVVIGCLGICFSPLFPRLYNTSRDVRDMATRLLLVYCLYMPLECFVHCSYFTLRSGGKTIITFFFDSVFVLCVMFPVAFVLSRYTSLPMVPLYACVNLLNVIKAIIGLVLVKKGVWIQNIVKETVDSSGNSSGKSSG